MDFFKVCLTGRIVHNAETRFTTGGIACCKFSVAVNQKKKKSGVSVECAQFHDVIIWGRYGEAMEKYLKQGKEIVISGEMQQDSWEEDGKTRRKNYIKATDVKLSAGSRQSNTEETAAQDGPEKPQEFPDDIPF
jgi:single-strand DNA-binding protein